LAKKMTTKMAGKKKADTKKTGKKKAAKKTVTKKVAKKSATNQGELSFGAPGGKKKAPKKVTAPKTKVAGGKSASTASTAASTSTAAAATGPPRTSTTGNEPRKQSFSPVSRRIRSESNIIRQKILLGDKPTMKFPLRSLANVTYSSSTGYFKLKGKKKERTLTVNTVKTFAQTLKMMALSKELARIGHGDGRRRGLLRRQP